MDKVILAESLESLASEIIQVQGIVDMQSAFEYLQDDRSHGDDYVADAARTLINKFDINKLYTIKDEKIISEFVTRVLELAEQTREEE